MQIIAKSRENANPTRSAQVASITGRLLVVLAALLVLAAGCAPVISEHARSEVDPSVTFADVIKDPGAYKGTVVLAGGTILSTGNITGKTVIEVLEEPLGSRLRPGDAEDSRGRFIAEMEGFKDPAIYAPGRKITIAGRITGAREKMLGEMPYTYPVMSVREHYLWKIGGGVGTSVGIGLGVIYGN